MQRIYAKGTYNALIMTNRMQFKTLRAFVQLDLLQFFTYIKNRTLNHYKLAKGQTLSHFRPEPSKKNYFLNTFLTLEFQTIKNDKRNFHAQFS